MKYSNEPPLLLQMYSAWAGMGALGFMSPLCGCLGVPVLSSGPHWPLPGGVAWGQVWAGPWVPCVDMLYQQETVQLVLLCSCLSQTSRASLDSSAPPQVSSRSSGSCLDCSTSASRSPCLLLWDPDPLQKGHGRLGNPNSGLFCICVGAATPCVYGGDLPVCLWVSPALPLDFSLSREQKHM